MVFNIDYAPKRYTPLEASYRYFQKTPPHDSIQSVKMIEMCDFQISKRSAEQEYQA